MKRSDLIHGKLGGYVSSVVLSLDLRGEHGLPFHGGWAKSSANMTSL